MKIKNSVILLLIICLIIVILLLSDYINNFIAGLLFAFSLVSVGLATKGFKKK